MISCNPPALRSEVVLNDTIHMKERRKREGGERGSRERGRGERKW